MLGEPIARESLVDRRVPDAENSRPAIQLAAGAEIPDELKRIKIEFDGTKAYELWKAGEKLPASVIVKEGCHLRIS